MVKLFFCHYYTITQFSKGKPVIIQESGLVCELSRDVISQRRS